MRLPNGTYVLVCDAAKALLLVNRGDSDQLDLRVIDVLTDTNPPTREQASDRPGRFKTPNGGRAAAEETDWHELGEDRFIQRVAEKTLKIISGSPSKLVVAADPRSLGKLRPRLVDSGSINLIAEIGQDFAHQTVTQIETALSIA